MPENESNELSGRPEVATAAESSRAQEERRTNQIRLLQTGVEAVKLAWEVANRFWR